MFSTSRVSFYKTTYFKGKYYHYILRFKISVDNFKGMQDSHAHHDLLAYLCSIILFQVVVILDELVEIFALYKLSDDVDVGLALDTFLELEKKGVRHCLHNAALMAE